MNDGYITQFVSLTEFKLMWKQSSSE